MLGPYGPLWAPKGWATANLQSPTSAAWHQKLIWKNNITQWFRISLLGLCTNIAINSHFTTLLLLTRHVSDFIFILIVFDIYRLDFYFNVYLLYVAYVNYIIKRIWYMVWSDQVGWGRSSISCQQTHLSLDCLSLSRFPLKTLIDPDVTVLLFKLSHLA